MDMEEYARKLMQGKNAAALDALTQSGEGAKIAARFDGAAVEKAAREGDMQTLSRLMKDILSTPEGRSFADQVRRTVNGNGQ